MRWSEAVVTRVIAGVYGATRADLTRLERAVGTVEQTGALAVGWAGRVDAALGDHGCLIEGRIDSSADAAYPTGRLGPRTSSLC